MKQIFDRIFWVVFAMVAISIVVNFVLDNVPAACAYICTGVWMFVAREQHHIARMYYVMWRELCEKIRQIQGNYVRTQEIIRQIIEKKENHND